MRLSDLNKEQKHQLKEAVLCERQNVSYGELIDAENLISDDDLEAEFGTTEFVEEDFLKI